MLQFEPVRSGALCAADLVAPLFVCSQNRDEIKLGILPSARALPVDKLLKEAEQLCDRGINKFILFEVGAEKDENGSYALSSRSSLPSAIQELKRNFPQTLVCVDLCLCQYTSHGHCGLIINGKVDNDQTLAVIQQLALIYTRSGADVVMPSGMLDGAVQAVRQTLDLSGFSDRSIWSQSAKLCSSLFGPFRKFAQAGSLTTLKDTYQIPFSNRQEALLQLRLDAAQGADMLFVKPALTNLDILAEAARSTCAPLAAFCTSGEHALYFCANESAADNEKIEGFAASLRHLKRCGASVIFTYAASELVEHLS